MSETYQFKLPYVQAAQAQKHVTVNEALAKLDALAQLRVQSRTVDVPGAPIDGQTYIVPVAASGDWLGQAHKIALFLNGGWEFVDASDGWAAWVIDEAAELRFQSGAWDYATASVDPNLGSIIVKTIEADHTIITGSFNVTSVVIPSHTVVFGVTGRVIQTVNGPVATKVGVDGATGRYGSGYGCTLNSYILGLTSKPTAYFEDTPLRLTSEDADYVDGVVRLCIHLAVLTPPAAV